nr:LysR substrate-binding domain-containing protein [uncultured Moellerella sp.]
MSSQLPLQALRTFVEIGRRGSLKSAAQTLHVTSGAISQQIRLLEERLGIELFIRERSGMKLSPAGEQIYPTLLEAFQQIEIVTQQLSVFNARKIITINTIASFAASWLVPRLKRFQQQFPNIEIRVEASSTIIDMKRTHVDIAIRHGLGYYPELKVTRLMTPELIPVAAPSFFLTGNPIKAPIDCLNYPLLQDGDRADWSLWLAAHGVAYDQRADKGSEFEDDFLLIRAAEAGLGLALVPSAYAKEEIAANRLIQVLDKAWPSRFAYYIVTKPEAENQSEINTFIQWLLEEGQKNN